MRTLLFLLLSSCFAAAHAQSGAPSARIESENGVRYQLQDTPDGTVRLDTKTGEMTLCTTTAGRLACRIAAEERSAIMAELDRLEARVAALEGSDESGAGGTLSKSEERQIDKALAAAERLMRGLGAIAQDFRSK